MSECRKNYEIDSEGNYRSQDLYYGETYGMEISDCVPSGLARRVFVPGMDTGSIYYTPGFSNGGWGNFSEPVSPYGGFGIDTTGDGFADASYSNYSLNDTDYSRSGHLTGNYESMAFMAFGEYTFEGASNLTAYFETLINDSPSYHMVKGYFQTIAPPSYPSRLQTTTFESPRPHVDRCLQHSSTKHTRRPSTDVESNIVPL